jgi:hypothetical protein
VCDRLMSDADFRCALDPRLTFFTDARTVRVCPTKTALLAFIPHSDFIPDDSIAAKLAHATTNYFFFSLLTLSIFFPGILVMAETTKSSEAPKSAVAATLEQLKPQEAESKTLKIENTDKRDTLIAEEKKYQKSWEEQGVFNPDAPSLDEEPFDTTTPDQLHEKFPKWLGCFAYPYMNGTLHAGHGFTASKVEFTAGCRCH